LLEKLAPAIRKIAKSNGCIRRGHTMSSAQQIADCTSSAKRTEEAHIKRYEVDRTGR